MTPDLDALVRRARRLAEARPRGRCVLGVTGAPGAGKTTLAVALVEALNEAGADASAGEPGREAWAVHVPMDGFHLADAELGRLGRLGRKGAPDTFDPAGYAALLQRVREDVERTVYAPAFDRDLEQPVAGAIAVPPSCRLVVTEGNYLLLDDPAWQPVRGMLDEVWFCDLDDGTRRRRLVERHVRFGKSEADAEAWVSDVDEPNAVAVAGVRDRAELVVTWP